MNYIKIIFGHMIIGLIHYPWRIFEQILGKSLNAATKAHYYIMMVFRALYRSYPVIVKYPSPVLEGSDITLKVNLCQNNQQWFFRLKGKYEREWIQIMAEGMKDAEAFLDIGSNIGIYAMTIAQAFPDKKVTAIEPLKDNFNLLNDNILLNKLLNVKTHNAVVTNSSEASIPFYPNPIHDGGGSTIQTDTYRTGDVLIDAGRYKEQNSAFEPEVTIANLRVDDLVQSRSVLKVDVEGAEVSVLESARNSLSNGLVDLVIVEVLDETIDGVISLLNELQFECFAEDSSAPLQVGDQLHHFVGNILGLRRGSSQYDTLRNRLASKNINNVL